MESIVPEKDVAELDAKQLEEELNKNVGVAVDYSTMTRNNLFKFLIFSAIGVWVFFLFQPILAESAMFLWCS